MSDAELTDAEINERVALAMGWVQSEYEPSLWSRTVDGGCGIGPLPNFLRDDAAFVALLRWHAAEGRTPVLDSVRYEDDPEWKCLLWIDEKWHVVHASTPHRALALATLAVRP